MEEQKKNPQPDNGWIKLHRKIINTSWYYKRSTVVHLFIHLLIKANHQENKFFWNGKEITIKRGEFITGLNKLSEETGISIQSIRTALTILKSTNTITIKSTNKFSIIQIVNYDQYQSEEEKLTSKLTSKVTNNQQTTNKQLTTNKNDKNDKNEKNIYILEREYTSINYLIKIPQEDLYEFYSIYQASKEEIIRKAEQLYNYCQAHGKRYKNYKAFLRNALERDFKRRPQRLTIEKTGVSLREIYEARQREKGGGQNG